MGRKLSKRRRRLPIILATIVFCIHGIIVLGIWIWSQQPGDGTERWARSMVILLVDPWLIPLHAPLHLDNHLRLVSIAGLGGGLLYSGVVYLIARLACRLTARRDYQCTRCRYDLRGTIVAGKDECPECGHVIEKSPAESD